MSEKALPKKERTVSGVEEVVLLGPTNGTKVLARIDTGAYLVDPSVFADIDAAAEDGVHGR